MSDAANGSGHGARQLKTRADKIGTTIRSRQQPALSNNLSKGATITIAVVIAAVVVTAIVVATKANDAPGDIRIC